MNYRKLTTPKTLYTPRRYMVASSGNAPFILGRSQASAEIELNSSVFLVITRHKVRLTDVSGLPTGLFFKG